MKHLLNDDVDFDGTYDSNNNNNQHQQHRHTSHLSFQQQLANEFSKKWNEDEPKAFGKELQDKLQRPRHQADEQPDELRDEPAPQPIRQQQQQHTKYQQHYINNPCLSSENSTSTEERHEQLQHTIRELTQLPFLQMESEFVSHANRLLSNLSDRIDAYVGLFI
ncbi:hypothetical protein HELRODRAFT_182536 [Helobdella robusta]|uniref:Uncharacterized protein n=1 Tax=Helobdella robusta TaxID=6412 RepID=T1FIB9_HELRO|nr:hypothetical protein HELRODRAFT_182536 [Helobdella robusta]ESN90827.1 hypothetical protein HELRODRAFT_182536 [Helobdella robusta]